MSPSATWFVIDFEPLGRRITTGPEETLLDAAQSAGVGLQAICGGAGICGTCLVRRMSGELSPPTSLELAELSAEDLSDGCRLACQARPLGDLRVDVPPDSLTAPQRLQVEARGGALGPEVLTGVGEAARQGLGLAIDLGTTKVAAYLVDLPSGRTLAMGGVMNPQIAYGEDIISRIAWAGRDRSRRRLLQTRLIDALNNLVNELCLGVGVRAGDVVEAVAVGNTVMHHLFAGLEVAQLGVAPYRPALCEPLVLSATELHLSLAPEATIYLPPNIAGYVGGDHVATLLASGADEAADVRLIVDIGTNTEVSLLRLGQLLSCSCPSGPAFEGAHISAGMRAAPGAIERVRIVNGQVLHSTIGAVRPRGICGSGILDAVAEMVRAGVLNRRGALLRNAAGVRVRNGQAEFLLVPGGSPGQEREIVITRRDVNEIQLAKAAVRTGIDTMLDLGGVARDEIQNVFLAGAFGTYLDVRSAIAIGMFPPLPVERFHQVGNAAGLGARQMLVSIERRRRAEHMARRARYVELSGSSGFTRRFIHSVSFEAAAPEGAP